MLVELINARNKPMQHLAMMLYDEPYECTPPPADRNRVPTTTKAGTVVVSFDLLGDRLSFKEPSTDALDYDETEPGECPKQTSTSLALLPHLSNLAKNKPTDGPNTALTIDPDFSNQTMKADKVAAALLIDFGKVTAGRRYPIVWNFRDQPGKDIYHRQQIAEHVDWDFNISGDVLTVQTTPIGTANKSDLVTLKAHNGKIELKIVNVHKNDVPIARDVSKAPDLRVGREDEHFPMYYDFIKGWSGPRPRPFAEAVCAGNGNPTSEPCVLREFVRIDASCPPPPTRPTPKPAQIGGLNCGPNQLP
ncbi:MAG: hypothetical protein M3Q69_00040 [Acidobacteriota bacterium]|nr:hypothetical protein [Acidobacteriota bacterium]